MEGQAGWSSPARRHHLVAVPSSCRHAAVWRDLDSLERWTRSEPHRRWWQQFLKDSGGPGFWHEAYFMRGGIDAIYDDMDRPTGIARFASARPARGAMFSARHRAGRRQALTYRR